MRINEIIIANLNLKEVKEIDSYKIYEYENDSPKVLFYESDLAGNELKDRILIYMNDGNYWMTFKVTDDVLMHKESAKEFLQMNIGRFKERSKK